MDTLRGRSFFSAFFELASSIFIGNVIPDPNHALNLLIVLGRMRNSWKCNLNLPNISCSVRHCSAFRSKIFVLYCFVNIWCLVMFSFNWDTCLTEIFFWMLLFWRSILYRSRKYSINWSILLYKVFPWFDGSKRTFKGQFEDYQCIKSLSYIRYDLGNS